jgi:hypothetical protein
MSHWVFDLMWIPFGVIVLLLGLGLFAAPLGEAERTAKPASWIPLILVPLLLALAGSGCDSPSDRAYAEEITRGHTDAGKKDIERNGCGSCHRIPGISGADSLIGPSPRTNREPRLHRGRSGQRAQRHDRLDSRATTSAVSHRNADAGRDRTGGARHRRLSLHLEVKHAIE